VAAQRIALYKKHIRTAAATKPKPPDAYWSSSKMSCAAIYTILGSADLMNQFDHTPATPSDDNRSQALQGHSAAYTKQMQTYCKLVPT
jgi:hypothetical protein